MILLLAAAAGGLLSLPLWPEPWRLALACGWTLAMALEALLLVRRRRELAAGSRSLLATTVLGFLAKLAILTAGGILGAYSGWFDPAPFLLSFLAGAMLGEGAVFASLHRASRERPASAPEPSGSARPSNPS